MTNPHAALVASLASCPRGMISLLRIIAISLSAFLLTTSHAVIDDAPTFETPAQHQQYNELIDVIRCPTCQNQNIAESNAALARQLRQIIVDKIHAGESSEHIVDYLVQRYGDFITYDPPFKPVTWLLWLGPVGLMIIALLYWLLRKRRTPQQTLTREQRETLHAMIEKYR